MTSPPNAPTNTATPAGWHPDPLGRVGYRYWDGERWSPYGSVDGTTLVLDTDGRLPLHTPSAPDSLRAAAFLASVVALAAIGAFALWRAGPDDGTAAFSVATPAPSVVSGDTPSDPTPDLLDDPVEQVAPPKSRGTPDDDPSFDQFESAWPVSGVPIKVVYLTETSNGEEWEEIIASDPPRSISRGPNLTMFNDGTDVVRCIEDECRLQDDEWAETFDYLDNRISFLPPSEIPNSFSRRIAGREAICTEDQGPGTNCWDSQTGILVLVDPGDEAMEPSAFTSTRITATYLGPPDESDFDLPSEVLPPENR